MSKPDNLYAYPPDIEELAFACYVKADRNISRAHRLLLELGTDHEFLPDRSTISKWASRKQWDVKADQAIANNFPHLLRRDLARLMALRSEALNTYASILAGELDHLKPPALMARQNTAKDVLTLAGLGTAGAKSDPGSLAPVAPIQQIEESLSPAERARRQRDRLESER